VEEGRMASKKAADRCGRPGCMLRDGHDGPCEPDRREGRRGRTEAEEEGARAAKRGRVAATPGDDKRRPGPGAKYSASGAVCWEEEPPAEGRQLGRVLI